MRRPRFTPLAQTLGVAALAFLVPTGCDDDHQSHDGGGPSDSQIRERENLASLTVDEFFQTFLVPPAGTPDPAFFSASFDLDGLDRTEYLTAFWTFDGAAAIPDGVKLIDEVDQQTTSTYDFFVDRSSSLADFSTPVWTEFLVNGETVVGQAPTSGYESLDSFFLIEDPTLLQVQEQGTKWEGEVLAALPESYYFAVSEIQFYGDPIYSGFPAPEFLVSVPSQPGQVFLPGIIAAAGDTFRFDIFLEIVGQPDAQSGPVNVDVEARLFLAGSPATGFGNVTFGQSFAATFNNHPLVSGILVVPQDLPAGSYSIVVSVVNSLAESYATDTVYYPFEVVQ